MLSLFVSLVWLNGFCFFYNLQVLHVAFFTFLVYYVCCFVCLVSVKPMSSCFFSFQLLKWLLWRQGLVDEDVLIQWAGGVPGTKVGYIIERKPTGEGRVRGGGETGDIWGFPWGFLGDF